VRQWFGLVILALAVALPACSAASRVSGQNDRVLILVGEEFDPQEFWGPYAVLHAAGYRVDLAHGLKGVELKPDQDVPEANIRTNIRVDEVDVSNYFALVVPGGPGTVNVARFPEAGKIAREFDAAGKPIGTVCHGARLLMPEGIFKNRRTTFVFMIADELADQWRAGDYGTYLDLPVVIDRNLISSRDPRDVPTMSKALVDRFAELGGLRVPQRDGRVLIVLPGATKHQRWVLNGLRIFGLSPIVWGGSEAEPINTQVEPIAADLLVILDGSGIGRLSSSKSLASMVDAFRKGRKPVLVSETVRQSLLALDLSGSKVIPVETIAHAMRQIVLDTKPAMGSAKAVQHDTESWAARYAAVSVTPIKGAPWDAAVEYDGVLALWHGYDDDAAARMREFLARIGRRTLIVGPERGALAGLNGSKAEVAATYEDPIRLSASAIIVAPGGLWPKKTNAQQAVQPQWVEAEEPARQRRLRWLTEQYESGRMTVAIGFDSLYLGQQPLFKGKQFASTDQVSVIWFGSTGAEYSPARARFSDENLLTVKPLVGVDEAMTMLQGYVDKKRSGQTCHRP
jgi:protease I